MANKRITKTSLILFILSIAIFVTTAVGTTFAWFSDTVSAATNIISSGNLDLELEYLDDEGNWSAVKEDTNLFSRGNWEPGHTEVIYLKVVNAGTLAFDYKLGTHIVEEKSSVNVYGDTFKLSDYIRMGVVFGKDPAKFESRDEAINAVSSKSDTIGTKYSQDSKLEKQGDVEYISLVVYFPNTVGNEANYKTGEEAPSITFGISFYATQMVFESDDFGNDYDEDADQETPAVPSNKQTIDVDVYDAFNANMPVTALEGVELTIYEFVAANFEDSHPLTEYKDWTCDFFVSSDSPVEDGVILIGNYADFGWLGFWVPESDQAYEPTGLLGAVTNGGESNWTYQAIHEDVQIFRCGLIDYYGNNKGVNVTVDLRMTNPEKTQTITVVSITVTL